MTADYNDWHPHQKIAHTAQALAHAVPPPEPTTRKTRRRKILARNRPHEEQTAVTIAQALECSEGFGEGQHRLHWIPPSETGCARCGKEAHEIAQQQGATA